MRQVKPTNARAFVDAAYSGDLKTVRLMVEAGMAVDTRDRGSTALQVAIAQGHARIVQTLLQAGADPNAADRNGLSPLVQAIRSGSFSVVRALLAAKADVNRAEKHGKSRETPLMTAAMQGDLKLVKLLIHSGADSNARSRRGLTALDFARMGNQEQVIRFLQAQHNRSSR